ncbi:hypothetical protein WDU94_000950, partial [Cyamophila willieti]
RSFVPPVRDEESETQRKAHAKRVRETRRSTQGVTLEELKSAEQLVKKKQQQQLVQASQQPSPEKETPDNSDRSNTTQVTVSATITSTPSPLTHSGERRPSWRLRVDNGVKFMLEDARDNPSNTDRTRGATDTAETTVTIPLRRPGKLNVDSDKEQDKENDSGTLKPRKLSFSDGSDQSDAPRGSCMWTWMRFWTGEMRTTIPR